MAWIIITPILLILAVAALVVAGKASAKAESAQSRDGEDFLVGTTWVLRVIAVIFGGVIVIWTALASIHQVPAGHVGVVYEFGAIVDQKDDGLVIIPPWRSVKNATTQVQTLAFVDDETWAKTQEQDFGGAGVSRVGDDLDSASSETQDVFIDAILNVQVSPDNVQYLYTEVGPDYISKLIPGRIAQFFKDETANYPAVEIIPSREKIKEAVEAQIRRELSPYSVEVLDLFIDNVAFSSEFSASIEAKGAAAQEALRQQELVKAEKAKADQKIEAARGEAERLRVEANGQADANRAINESLTPLLIQFQALQKLADNVQIALIPSGEGTIIDPSTLFGQLQPTPAP